MIGLIQHITYDEFLPLLLGQSNFDKIIGPYKYDVTSNPTLFTEFSTAVFRLGHPLINSPYRLMNNNGKLIREMRLGEMFFNSGLLNDGFVNQMLNGLARSGAKARPL